jgi:hypothetical protein
MTFFRAFPRVRLLADSPPADTADHTVPQLFVAPLRRR